MPSVEPYMFTLDLINTVAFGGAVRFLGHSVRRVIPALARYTVPAPVIGGLIVAVIIVPMVGAFFIDFVNTVIITVCLNIWA
jgi:Na+/glutamate symporter